jgi:thiol-disulfide isomerase/thioredoxin
MDDSDFFDTGGVKELTPRDFEDVATWRLRSSQCAAESRCTAILFYCAWCPHCQKVKGEWEKFGRKALFLDVAAFNCERYKSHIQKIKEDIPGLIPSYPSIIFYKNGSPSESYKSEERTVLNFIKTAIRVCNGH